MGRHGLQLSLAVILLSGVVCRAALVLQVEQRELPGPVGLTLGKEAQLLYSIYGNTTVFGEGFARGCLHSSRCSCLKACSRRPLAAGICSLQVPPRANRAAQLLPLATALCQAGYYIVDVGIGTPSQYFQLLIDTGG